MKKTVFALFFLLSYVGLFAQTDIKNLGISQFYVVADAVSSSEANVITTLFISEIESLDYVKPVNRVLYELELDKQNFTTSDFNNSAKTLTLAKAVSADYLIKSIIGKVGEKISLEAYVIDPQTADILSTRRIILNSLDDLITDIPNFATLLTSHIVDSVKIGGMGQSSGYIFFINSDGSYYESSEVIGNATWHDASQIASNYRGGGYDDWRLPSKSELDIIYLNLRKGNRLTNDKPVWCSDERSELHAWQQRFSDGYQGFNYKSSSNDIIVIRESIK